MKQADVVTTRTIRVFIRTKSRKAAIHRSVKVVKNCRVPGRKKPIQLHLGYLSLMFDGGIPEGQRKKLRNNLNRKWAEHFPHEAVDIDWEDAEEQLAELRARLRPQLDPLPPEPPPSGGGGAARSNRRRDGAQPQTAPPDAG